MDLEITRKVLAALEREGVQYVVFGAVAINLLGLARATVDLQYNPPEGALHLDILTRLGEAFRFQDLEAIRVELDGQLVSVASPRTLYRMKKGTIRPKDWGDAEALRRRFHLEDE